MLPKSEGAIRSSVQLTLGEFWRISRDNQSCSCSEEAKHLSNANVLFLDLYLTAGISSAPEAESLPASLLASDISVGDLVPLENHFANLWLGSPGVVAQTHFDQEPNFAVQIAGHKRWILSPPSEAVEIMPYPYLHASHRQSMRPFRSSGPSNDPLAFRFNQSIRGMEVLANPGNVLYIPPFWFHRVITEDESIAISTRVFVPRSRPNREQICGQSGRVVTH